MPVNHSIYKQGQVVSMTNNRIRIQFVDGNLKSFLFPQAFTDGFLTVENDPNLRKVVEKAQRKINIAKWFHEGNEERTKQRLIMAITPKNGCDVVLNQFKGKYAFLNPASKCKIEIDNVEYSSVADAFYHLRKKASECSDVDLLRKILLTKYSISKFRKKMLETKNYFLVYKNNYHENVMGACLCKKCRKITKQNIYGQLLMEVRSMCQQLPLSSEVFCCVPSEENTDLKAA